MSNHQKRGTDKIPKPNSEQEDRPNDSNRDGQNNNSSLASRIQNSAAGLARNAFLPSAPSGDTAQLLSDGSKATPSGSTSALAAAERYRDSSTPTSSSSTRDSANYTASKTFRTSSTLQTGGFELPPLTEDEFQTSYGYGDVSETSQDTGKGKGKVIASEYNLTRDPDTVTTTQGTSSLFDITTPVATLVPSDGDAVVALLSDRTFDPDFPPSADEPFEYIDTELQVPQLTPAEIQMIESFRRQLPPEVSAQHIPSPEHRLNSLSLVPDIGSFLDTMPSQAATDATTLRDAVLTSLPGAEDWVSVEEKYHDEVWGYLQPTLEAAVKEIESRKDSPENNEDGPAVRRLKMILKHMQG